MQVFINLFLILHLKTVLHQPTFTKILLKMDHNYHIQQKDLISIFSQEAFILKQRYCLIIYFITMINQESMVISLIQTNQQCFVINLHRQIYWAFSNRQMGYKHLANQFNFKELELLRFILILKKIQFSYLFVSLKLVLRILNHLMIITNQCFM